VLARQYVVTPLRAHLLTRAAHHCRTEWPWLPHTRNTVRAHTTAALMALRSCATSPSPPPQLVVNSTPRSSARGPFSPLARHIGRIFIPADAQKHSAASILQMSTP
jgi:hypothetical protein